MPLISTRCRETHEPMIRSQMLYATPNHVSVLDDASVVEPAEYARALLHQGLVNVTHSFVDDHMSG